MYQGKSIKTEIFVMMERETCRFKHGKWCCWWWWWSWRRKKGNSSRELSL